jgi:hypothetical protein
MTQEADMLKGLAMLLRVANALPERISRSVTELVQRELEVTCASGPRDRDQIQPAAGDEFSADSLWRRIRFQLRKSPGLTSGELALALRTDPNGKPFKNRNLHTELHRHTRKGSLVRSGIHPHMRYALPGKGSP